MNSVNNVVTLPTVIYGKETGAMRPTRRRTEIHESPGASTVAYCTSTSRSPVIRFNTATPGCQTFSFVRLSSGMSSWSC